MGDDKLSPGLWLGNNVTAKRCEQSAFGTADCTTICRCDDGSDYAIKDGIKQHAIPHSEWFCTKLGEAVGLASPPCKVVDVQGNQWFGSRWETGHNAKDWWLRAAAKQLNFDLLRDTISRIFAFDLFVHNVDRHLTNFIVREQHLGISMLAFDYSRAWLCHGFPLPSLPMSPSTKTIRALRYLKVEFGNFISIAETDKVLTNIAAVPDQQIDAIIGSHPQKWLTESQKTAILNWWKSSKKTQRIDMIIGGIKDGTYL
jgi:hypothetical protein